MKGELYYVRHPYRSRILWIIFYVLLFLAFIFGLYILANKIKTHSLPTGEINLKIPYSKYLVGEAVSFSITNNFNSPVYINNNCPSEPLAVYRQEKGVWIRLHDTASVADCVTEQRQVIVPARGVVNGSFAPWRHLFNKPGKYRIVAFVEYYNALPYQEFEVINPPPIPKSSAPTQNTTPSTDDNTTSLGPSAVSPVQSYPAKQTRTITTQDGSSITVQYDSVMIYVTSIAPASGCTYEGGRSGTQVQVTFQCGGSETQVQLNIINGQLVQNIETGN